MSFVRAKAITVSFPLIDTSSRPSRKAGLTFTAGTAKISQDGGAFANTTNLPSAISSGRYSLALTAAEMDAKLVHVYVSVSGADDYDERFETTNHRSGSVTADGANTASTFHTSLSEGATDYWKDSLLMFTSGALVDQVKKITAFNAATAFVSLQSGFTAAPSAGDLFVLISF